MGQVKLNPIKCAKCGKLKIVRMDGNPLCGECEKQIKSQFARMRPDLAHKGELVLDVEARFK